MQIPIYRIKHRKFRKMWQQRNMFQMNEHNKNPRRNPKINGDKNKPAKEFKEITINILK